MKKLVIILLFVFLVSFISALDVGFDCPSSVSVGEEFVCQISLDGSYDVKVDLLCGGGRCAKIWNGEFWGSTYYFVKGFSGDSIRLKIVENYNGNCEGKLRLREFGSSSYSYEESFSIQVVGSDDFVEEDIEIEKLKIEKEVYEEEIVELSDKDDGGIVLNSISDDEEIIYVSRNEKIKNLAIYGFALFLVFVIVVLILRR